ncbi:uncharacterized protein [Panulirus ornatus]|uniref:uncharacterized protein n=1 Tax=Panulirus ornatus TaxID=150431 RepID=UPI003A83A998
MNQNKGELAGAVCGLEPPDQVAKTLMQRHETLLHRNHRYGRCASKQVWRSGRVYREFPPSAFISRVQDAARSPLCWLLPGPPAADAHTAAPAGRRLLGRQRK